MPSIFTHVQKALKAKKQVAIDIGTPQPISSETAELKILEDGILAIYENGIDRFIPLTSIRFIDTKKAESE